MKCKLHGYEKKDDHCPQCSANFWEQEWEDTRGVLTSIRDIIYTQIPDGEVITEIEKLLKDYGLM